jgi:nitrogen fixation/metabolism regulation signal transduction histidine kinase
LKLTTLGTISEPIIWKRKDEIGALISEYNRMLEELHRSAELLARSERETAWREMAKQVAHEIKNPLTPMKLGVQHLQRAWNDNHPDKEQLLQRISNTLIEQINTLSNIATAFSNFAKLPKTELIEVDLSKVIETIVDLYREPEDVEIIYSNNLKNCFIKADRDQLVRIFSNLMKNAVQAIPENKKGIINIELLDRKEYYEVRISDNGIGINETETSKIFVPNFTTKTSGMGLGLAMVKSMVEGMEGQISFISEVNVGTTFIVKFNKVAMNGLL